MSANNKMIISNVIPAIDKQVLSSRFMKKDNTMIKRLKNVISAFSLSLLIVATANAASISGNVFLDYDNSGNNTNAPLNGIKVELLNNNGESLATPLITTTNPDGSYTLNSPSGGAFKIKASTSNNEKEIIAVNVGGGSGISGQNLFLKGAGGDITVQIKDEDSNGVKMIPMIFSTDDHYIIESITDTSGLVTIKNSLLNVTYTASVDPSEIIGDTANTKFYALWDATKTDNTQVYSNKIDFIMKGNNLSGSFNVRERNEWGADGIIALDQDDNGIYTAGIDTPISGMEVALYYKGTNARVLGTSAIVTGDNGKYNFKNLALGDYTVKLVNVSSPWQLVTSDQSDVVIKSSL